jgi:hypothetical protein
MLTTAYLPIGVIENIPDYGASEKFQNCQTKFVTVGPAETYYVLRLRAKSRALGEYNVEIKSPQRKCSFCFKNSTLTKIAEKGD